MTRDKLEQILPKKKDVPEYTDTSGWDNHGDIADANSKRYENMAYNQAISDCLDALDGKVILKSEAVEYVEPCEPCTKGKWSDGTICEHCQGKGIVLKKPTTKETEQ
jgi:hypothetical protein